MGRRKQGEGSVLDEHPIRKVEVSDVGGCSCCDSGEQSRDSFPGAKVKSDQNENVFWKSGTNGKYWVNSVAFTQF